MRSCPHCHRVPGAYPGNNGRAKYPEKLGAPNIPDRETQRSLIDTYSTMLYDEPFWKLETAMDFPHHENSYDPYESQLNRVFHTVIVPSVVLGLIGTFGWSIYKRFFVDEHFFDAHNPEGLRRPDGLAMKQDYR